jgi:hypothetical protein
MHATSKKILSRLVRLSTAGILAATLLSDGKPALAMVDAPSGDWNFTLYENIACEGSYFYQAASTSYTLSVADLTTHSFNDKASAWSLCNNTTKTATVTITLYTDINYGGTVLSEATNATVPSGLCLTQNTISPNDAVSSFKVTATLD